MDATILRGKLKLVALSLLFAATGVARGANLRIATYNLQDDVASSEDTDRLNQLARVIEGIGQQNYVGDSIQRLPDIVSLQETTNSASLRTTTQLLATLNGYYATSSYGGAVTYASSSTKGTSTGGTGGGPNDIIYNSKTLTLLQVTPVGTSTGSNAGTFQGEFRQVMRYEFQPKSASGVFYVYVSHMKSGAAGSVSSGSQTNGFYRNEEATIIRNNAATLPSDAQILYTGDYNWGGSTEPTYQTMTSTATSNAAIDPMNPTNSYTQNWHSSSYKSILTDSVDTLQYRDDMLMMTSSLYHGMDGGLTYVTGSYHVFGNNGSTAYQADTNLGTNTSLNDITGYGPLTPAQVLAAMNSDTGSDHLPVVADFFYAATVPEMGTGGVVFGAAVWGLCIRRGRRRL